MEEQVELLKSGKIRVQLDDKTIVLQRPTVKVLRRLSEVATEIIEKVLNDAKQRLTETGELDETDTQQMRALRVTSVAFEGYLKYWKLAYQLLTDVDIDVEDLPSCFASQEFFVAANEHWKTVPLVPGQPAKLAAVDQ